MEEQEMSEKINIDEELKNAEKVTTDVLIIGAGGAGLRAAIGAAEKGATVAVVSKSLLGKAHTVMAEGGAAAALGNIDPRDNWKVHFRDTMKGGKMHNDWRMVKTFTQQAPDRILELEKWGAVWDRTKDGKISQRNFGGHEYPRLAHVGDRTGMEMIRTLQNRAIHEKNIRFFMECTVTKLFKKDGKVVGALAYYRQTGTFVIFKAKAIIIASGGLCRVYRITTNSWELTGDGNSLALDVGAELVDIEFIQFHPTGMVWPPSIAGILVTEGVRGEGGILKNSEGKRFMFNYIPEYFKGDYAETEEEAMEWLRIQEEKRKNPGKVIESKARRPPELLTRDVVAKAILAEVKAGRGSKHGGAYLDVASVLDPEYIKRKLPAMHHQFMTLADLDITKEPMEVGPTAHYAMGGIKVDPETQETSVPGLFAAGEVASGLHGANRLGGNSLTDLVVFGRLAGEYAGEYVKKISDSPEIPEEDLKKALADALEPFEEGKTLDPFAVHAELKKTMEEYVGIIRTEEKLKTGIEKLEAFKEKIKQVKATGSRVFNPGWNLAVSLRHMVNVGLAIAHAALARKESRGAHTRDDYPQSNPDLQNLLYVIKLEDGKFTIKEDSYPPMPEDLQKIMEGEVS